MNQARSIFGRLVGTLAATGKMRRADRLARLLRTLISERGEATGATLARRAVALYSGLDEPGRLRLFDVLAR